MRIASGMSRIADPISFNIAANPFGSAAMRARSSGASGNSGTRQIDHRIVEKLSTAPTMNAIRAV